MFQYSLILVFLMLFLFPSYAQGSTLASDSYTLENGSVFLGDPTPTPYTYPGAQFVLPTPTPIPESSYTITVPKKDDMNNPLFGITLDTDYIDYGPLAPTDPIVRQSNLTVTPGKSFGYHIILYENSPLRDEKGNTIPSTSCDQGSCSESIPALWENVLSFGFGYRCDTKTVNCYDFIPNDVFKRLSSSPTEPLAKGITEQPLSLSLMYKLNISTTQVKSTYLNSITALILPNY